MLTWLKKMLATEPKSDAPVSGAVSDKDGQNGNTNIDFNDVGALLDSSDLMNPKTSAARVDEQKPILAKKSFVQSYQPDENLLNYVYPSVELLKQYETSTENSLDVLESRKDQILQLFRGFGIEIQLVRAKAGPTDTLFEIIPAPGIRIAKIVSLKEDIALNLNAESLTLIAPIPGKGTIGISIPNTIRQVVSLKSLLASESFRNNTMSLPIAIGKKMDNEDYVIDLATLPHLLLAGATGQGKTVCINAIIASLLYKKNPSQLKFVLIDTKQVELSVYRAIERHFLAKLPRENDPIVTAVNGVIPTLNALCEEMDNRYELLKEAGVRHVNDYNDKYSSGKLDHLTGHKYLPSIVLIIDEFADLILVAGREIERPLARIAQMARAVGIHMIIATQHPSSEVITSTIKANFLARLAFKVTSKINSRTILDVSGAEELRGNGDMLISVNNELQRVQCAYIDLPEIESVLDFITSQPGYSTAYLLPESYSYDKEESNKSFDPRNRDQLFIECAKLVVQMQSGSTSNIQRAFNLGYNRAGRIMDQLESASIVGPAIGSRPREVYIKTENELNRFLAALC